jgi:hypothetical protein
VPYTEACFCFQSLQATRIEDYSLSGNGANAYFSLSLRQNQLVKYRQETRTVTEYYFDSGGQLNCNCDTCQPTPTPTPPPCGGCDKFCGVTRSKVPQQCIDAVNRHGGQCGNWCISPGVSADYCYFDAANDRVLIWQDAKTCIDPPVSCGLYLTGPGLPKSHIGDENFNALPNFEYEGVARINQSHFASAGAYSLDVECSVALPEGTSECTPGCTLGSARVNFHVQTCSPAVSVQTDKSSYSSGELMSISGTLRNNNIPVSGNVNIKIKDASGSVVATIPATASAGSYSINYILPSSWAGGTYTVEAEAAYSSCTPATASVKIGYVPCEVTLSSQIRQSGSSSAVIVGGSVYNKGAPVANANVTLLLYKGGSLIRQSHAGTLYDGSYSIAIPALYGSGTYTAQIQARYLSCPAANAQNTIRSACDLRSAISLSGENFSSGQSVVLSGQMQDSFGNPVGGNYEVEIRDSSGKIVASASKYSPGGGIYEVFSGLGGGSYEATVTSHRDGCTSVDRASFGVFSDFSASLYSSPACGSAQRGYQVKIRNSLAAPSTVTISYSSIPQIYLAGPTSVYLAAYEEKIIGVDAVISDGYSGGSVGVLNFNNGNAAASMTLELPVCATGNLKLIAVDRVRSGSAGQEVCYKLQVENRGPDTGTVTMSYFAGSYYLDGHFDLPQFRISSYETRDDILFCAKVPNTQFSSIPITLRAGAPFGSSSDSVSLLTASEDLSISFAGCPYVARGAQFPISIYNNGDTADYTVEITDNGYLHPFVTPAKLYGFDHYSTQTVALSFAPTGLLAQNYVSIIIRKDGAVVEQAQLCFSTMPVPTYVPPAPTPTPTPRVYASALTPVNRSVLSQLPGPVGGAQAGAKMDVTTYAPVLAYSYDGGNFTANASFLVQNNEGADLYLKAGSAMLPAGWAIEFDPATQRVRPGEIREFFMRISSSSFEPQLYSGIFSVSDQDGRFSQSVFSVDATTVQPGGGTLTGFFSAAGSNLSILVLLLSIGFILWYGHRRNTDLLTRMGAA